MTLDRTWLLATARDEREAMGRTIQYTEPERFHQPSGAGGRPDARSVPAAVPGDGVVAPRGRRPRRRRAGAATRAQGDLLRERPGDPFAAIRAVARGALLPGEGPEGGAGGSGRGDVDLRA